MFPGLPEPAFFLPRRLKAWRWKRELYRKAFHAPVALHLSHGDCLDGAASDVLVRMATGPGAVETVFLSPHETADTLERLTAVPSRARRLILSDLSLQKGQGEAVAVSLEALAADGWRIEWRDHHHKQWEGAPLGDMNRHAHMEVDFTGRECGATLVQKALLPEDAFAEALARTVRDHDLWLREIPMSDTLEAAKARAGSERFRDRLLRTRRLDDAEIARWAAKQERRNAKLVTWALKRARLVKTNGQAIGVAYGRVPTNLVLHDLESRGAVLNVLLKPTGSFSLRSAKGTDVCHEVAQQFGGGGHPNASGGHLGLQGLGLPRLWLARDRHPRARKLIEAAVQAVEANVGRPAPAGPQPREAGAEPT